MFRCMFAALLMLPSALFAQGQYATISGIVTDSTGAVVPETAIVAANVGNRRDPQCPQQPSSVSRSPVFLPRSEHGCRRVTVMRPNGIIVAVKAELDRLIHEKRSHLKDAFAAHQKTREALVDARTHLSRLVQGDTPAQIAPDFVRDAQAEIQRLESQERDAATRFNAISEELAQLHCEKYGKWHVTWRGPRACP